MLKQLRVTHIGSETLEVLVLQPTLMIARRHLFKLCKNSWGDPFVNDVIRQLSRVLRSLNRVLWKFEIRLIFTRNSSDYAVGGNP